MFDEIDVLARGILLGLMVAAPVGPVGLLCIRRTIQKGLFVGFATGFGAAFADALFSAAAAFGVAAIMEFIREHPQPIHVFGGAFLLFIAWHTWHDKPRQPPKHDPEAALKLANRLHLHLTGAATAMVSSFFITMTNPATLFGVLAVVATFGDLQTRGEASMIVAGIFIGSSLWWFLLSSGTSLVRRHFTENRVVLINRITAMALTPLALWALGSGLWGCFNKLAHPV